MPVFFPAYRLIPGVGNIIFLWKIKLLQIQYRGRFDSAHQQEKAVLCRRCPPAHAGAGTKLKKEHNGDRFNGN